MSTPQQNTKAPRRSARKNKNAHAQPAPPIRGAVSENELSHTRQHTSGNQTDQEYAGARRKSNANAHKKPNGIRSTTSDATLPDKTRATPIKQAYAGATFTNSPAASALPIPSFYSKSVPSAALEPIPPALEERDSKQATPAPSQDESPSKRQSTPLDFLFEAARQAKGTPRGESPSARSGRLSVAADSPASGSPAPRDPESMFPFELDGASTPGEDGSPFATPFKERMEALKTTRSTSNGITMDEEERLAKSAALKKLLIKHSSPDAPVNVDLSNPFNARAPLPRAHLAPSNGQARARSNPTNPSYTHHQPIPGQSGQYFPPAPQFPQYTMNHGYRQTSNLRNTYGAATELEVAELSSDSAITPPRISTARKNPVPVAGSGQPRPAPTSQAPLHKTKPSMQQMEDELRNILKLDLTSKG